MKWIVGETIRLDAHVVGRLVKAFPFSSSFQLGQVEKVKLVGQLTGSK